MKKTAFSEKIKRNRLPLILSALILAGGAAAVFLMLSLIPVYTLKNVYAFSVEKEKARISTDETFDLKPVFTVLEEKGVDRVREPFDPTAVTYTSSDASVASIDENGHVVPHKEGHTELKAVWDDREALCTLDVYVPIKNIRLKERYQIMKINEEADLGVLVVPEDATLYEGVTYTCLTPDIAEMTEDGHIVLKKPGYAKFQMDSNGFTDQAVIRVLSPMTDVLWDAEPELTLVRGEEADFPHRYLPEDTTDNTKGAYAVSDPALASIDENGHLVTLNSGDVTVSYTLNQFERSSLVHIVVPLQEIRLSFSELTIRAGDVVQIPISYFPEDTTDDLTTEWTSSDPGVISVSPEGVVTAVNSGTAEVTASCQGFTASARFTVVIPITGVVISHPGAEINKGQTLQLSASVVPENTTEERYISWSSDNINVAVVENGLVTAVGAGEANIIAAHDDFTAVCHVTVRSPMTGVALEPGELTLVEGFTGSLSVIFYPEDTTEEKWIIWDSTDEGIARVENGVVTAVSEGECDIIASHGELGARIHVTVLPFVEVASVTLDRDAVSFGGPGESVRLGYSVKPDGAAVSFSTSNAAVATVSADGVITSVGPGSCIITVSSGAASATVSVSVAGRNIVVMLDPGHDGYHHGASYYGLLEHTANLRVSNTCKAYLESHYEGVTVLMTHSGEECPSGGGTLKQDLERRAQMAQDAGAAILVSQHFNVSAGHTASGCVAYISKQGNVAAQCQALASCILGQISSMFPLQNRGWETANSTDYFDSYGNPLDYYAINRHSANRGIPGIIVEHCFMDHPGDMVYLTSNEYLDRFGVADAIGIANYLGLKAK
ncbi:MAG: Ig-like domain-containing protein [Lachnospiraceae bacterium]|nr:Ig-like domain-containing protein [Lachnospiraceae bacterium]